MQFDIIGNIFPAMRYYSNMTLIGTAIPSERQKCTKTLQAKVVPSERQNCFVTYEMTSHRCHSESRPHYMYIHASSHQWCNNAKQHLRQEFCAYTALSTADCAEAKGKINTVLNVATYTTPGK